jgi:ATPase subunit of ABC transporter with duplicated ATPase domains
MPAVPSGVRVAAVFARGFAERSRPKGSTKKTSTPAEAKQKRATKTGSAKKTSTAKKTATAKKASTKTKKSEKKPANKLAKKPAKKPARKPKRVLTDEEKTKLEIRNLRKKALLREQPKMLPDKAWNVYIAQRLKVVGRSEGLAAVMPQLSTEFKALSSDEVQVSWTTAAFRRLFHHYTLTHNALYRSLMPSRSKTRLPIR